MIFVNAEQNQENLDSFHFNVIHAGRFYYIYGLSVANRAEQLGWVDAINKQKELHLNLKKRFEIISLGLNIFSKDNPVTCSCIYESYMFIGVKTKLYIGTIENGTFKKYYF